MKPLAPEALIFVHTGFPSYLLCSLHQAHFASPALRIILISDRNPNLHYVEWIDLDTLSGSWQEMARAYVHLSTNGEPFERFCFYRWFAVRELMLRLGLNRVLHLDSDMLLYFDPIREPLELGDAELAIGSTSSYSGHFAWITSPSAIDFVCETMLHLFRNATTLKELEKHFERQGPHGGGVCDMYALGWIAWNHAMPIHELNQIRAESVFDQSISDPEIAGGVEKWRMIDGRKTVEWEKNMPFFRTIEGDLVRALTIHFQGSFKDLLFSHMQNRTIKFRKDYLCVRFNEHINAIANRIQFRIRHYKRGAIKRIQKYKNYFRNG